MIDSGDPTPAPAAALRRRPARLLGTAGIGVAALALLAAPANAADPILPLSEVRAGMTGTAYTVVQGTQITSFPVTITDVQPAPDAPGGALIMIRAEGPLMAQTGGIAEGMSGSPVYVTGADSVPRVIGAISYGQGDEANVLGAVTPIERMIAVSSGARALERPAFTRASRPVRLVADRAAAVRLRSADPGVRPLYPLQRWSAAGFSPRLRGLVRSALGARADVQQVLPRTFRPPVTLQPGASMTTLVMGGDVVIGAIGTVTYVDGATVLGFGHPFTGAGATRMFLGDGYVYNVVPAPIKGASYKLGEPGTVQGMLTGDRKDAVVGKVGPVEAIRVRSSAQDTLRGTSSDLDVVLAPQGELAPLVSDLLQIEPLLRARDGLLSGTLRLRVTIRGGDLPGAVVYENTYAAAGDVAGVASGAVSRPMTILMQNATRVLEPGSVEIRQTLSPRIDAARILSARFVPSKARAGQRVKLVLTLQPFREDVRRVTVSVTLPGDLDPGRVAFRVVPNDANGFDPSPADLTGELGVGDAGPVRARRALRIADAGLLRERSTATRGVRVLRAARRLQEDRHDAVRLLSAGESAETRSDGIRVPVDGTVIYGGRGVARVTIRR